MGRIIPAHNEIVTSDCRLELWEVSLPKTTSVQKLLTSQSLTNVSESTSRFFIIRLESCFHSRHPSRVEMMVLEFAAKRLSQSVHQSE